MIKLIVFKSLSHQDLKLLQRSPQDKYIKLRCYLIVIEWLCHFCYYIIIQIHLINTEFYFARVPY